METMNIQLFNKIVHIKDDEHFFVKPFCDYFKIDFDNQVRRIKNDKICQIGAGKNTDKSFFGDEILRLTVSKRGFIRWIQLINPQIMQEELREKFIQFQTNIFDYLYEGTSYKIQFLEDMQTINAEANRLRSERGKIGAQLQSLNKLLATMHGMGADKWNGERSLYMGSYSQLTQ